MVGWVMVAMLIGDELPSWLSVIYVISSNDCFHIDLGESCVYRLLYGKYMILETHITEIWDLFGNEKNIMCFLHYILFIFVFSKLPLHTSLSATITSQSHCHTQHVLHCPLFLSFFNPPHLICFYFFIFLFYTFKLKIK